MKITKNTIIINVLVFIGLISFFEIFLRFLTDYDSTLNINIGGFKEHHEFRGTKLIPNYNSNGIKINSFSILGPEFEIDKKDKFRILSIGNSVTFAPPEKNYSMVLEKKLNNQYENYDFQVICAAVPGYDSYDALNWYDEFLYKLKPNIAIIYLGWNDLGQFHPFGLKYKNEKLEYSDRTFLGFLMDYFYLFRVPYFFLGRYERTLDVDLSDLTLKESEIINSYFPNDYYNNISQLIKKLKKNGTHVFLIPLTGLLNYDNITKEEIQKIIYPRGIKKKYKIYKGLFNKYKIALDSVSIISQTKMINLPSIITEPKDTLIFGDECHININGSNVFGNYIANSIKPEIDKILNSRNGTN